MELELTQDELVEFPWWYVAHCMQVLKVGYSALNTICTIMHACTALNGTGHFLPSSQQGYLWLDGKVETCSE